MNRGHDAAPFRVRYTADRMKSETRYYHVWFATKYRKWLLQGDVEKFIKVRITQIAQEKGISLLQYETVFDHVHLLIALSPEGSLSKAVNLIKGGSARTVLEQFPDIRMDAHTEHFWQRRFGSKEIQLEAVPVVAEYIRIQHERLEKLEQR